MHVLYHDDRWATVKATLYSTNLKFTTIQTIRNSTNLMLNKIICFFNYMNGNKTRRIWFQYAAIFFPRFCIILHEHCLGSSIKICLIDKGNDSIKIVYIFLFFLRKKLFIFSITNMTKTSMNMRWIPPTETVLTTQFSQMWE